MNFFAGSGSSATPWMKGDISALASCKAYRDASATSPAGTAWSSSDGTSQDGVYSIDPDGAGGNAKFPVYCDMTNDSGGWTLVWKVGDGTSIGNANYASASSDITSLSDVAYQNGVFAKLDDWVINALKSSIGSNDPVYRLEEDVSGSKQTDYFPGSCVFSNGGSFSQPDCRKMSATFVTPTWIQDSYAGGTGTPGFWCASSGPWESSVFCSSIGTRSAALHLYPAYVTDNAHTTRMTRVFVR